MAVECCGEPRTTRFCPECGERLSEASVLDGLLRHCRTSERVMRAHEAKLLRPRRGESPAPRDIASAERKRVAADKWKAWGDALSAIISPGE